MRVTVPALAASASSPAPIVHLGPITLVNGRVNYNDRFVRPNYNANLSELNGRLAAFSSRPPGEAAAAARRSRAAAAASRARRLLDITGKVNPLATPLALDIQAKARDLELPPLSPYAIKYAGYGIERGKMSVDLAYVAQPDGQLTASNKIILNQLAFGDKIEARPRACRSSSRSRCSPTATASSTSTCRSAARSTTRSSARRADLEGDHQPDGEGGDGAVLAARVGVRRGRRASRRHRVPARHGGDVRRRARALDKVAGRLPIARR